jgi:hypothetical protein
MGCIGSNDGWRKGSFMNVVLKRVFIALALVAVCAVILAATKSYGIWVITGFAVFLFILGILKKEKTPDKADPVVEDRGGKIGEKNNLN